MCLCTVDADCSLYSSHLYEDTFSHRTFQMISLSEVALPLLFRAQDKVMGFAV